MTPAPPLTGRCVVLRDFREKDLPAYAGWQRGDREWRRFDGPYFAAPSDEEVAQRVEAIRTELATGAFPHPRLRLAIADPATDMLLGMVVRYWISRESFWPAIGIDLYDPALWGRGLGTEALALWCDYLFRAEPRFLRLDLRTWSGSARMMRVAGKLGFRLEARFRRARLVDGVLHDALGYGILREEWERSPPPCMS